MALSAGSYDVLLPPSVRVGFDWPSDSIPLWRSAWHLRLLLRLSAAGARAVSESPSRWQSVRLCTSSRCDAGLSESSCHTRGSLIMLADCSHLADVSLAALRQEQAATSTSASALCCSSSASRHSAASLALPPGLRLPVRWLVPYLARRCLCFDRGVRAEHILLPYPGRWHRLG